VVLLDINLPDISGYEVCSRLKSDETTRNIPVIFHTATDATGVAKTRAELLGATAFLTYPVQTEHLITIVSAAAIRNTQSRST
jgi:CheY-like chemotaxis protein